VAQASLARSGQIGGGFLADDNRRILAFFVGLWIGQPGVDDVARQVADAVDLEERLEGQAPCHLAILDKCLMKVLFHPHRHLHGYLLLCRCHVCHLRP
jgi:hypothetical protein